MHKIKLSDGLLGTNFNFKSQTNFYKGKVREVYRLNEDYLAMIATDRISAFDHILPEPIPYKGQILNEIALKFLNETKDIVPNWLIESPHPAVSFGHYCEPIRIEMVIRGYLVGHAWRQYQKGERILCGQIMPDGMKENEPFPSPIITPATKADEGHDEDISPAEIVARKIVSENIYAELERVTRALYARGTELAKERGLILVDTKYEFGMRDNAIYLIDEVHTPDSSRYFYLDGFTDRLRTGQKQRHLSKEFVREWLMERNFQGLDGQKMPDMTSEDVEDIYSRYAELYEKLMGRPFEPTNRDHLMSDIQSAIESCELKYSS